MTPRRRAASNLHARTRPSDAQCPIAIVVAIASNGVIGADNRLPWRLPADLRHFRALTTGHAVIMGRRTWQSIGRPLPQRQNIVVTRQPAFVAEGAETASSLDEAIARVRMPPPAFVIGGVELYREALPRAATLHMTRIEHAFAGDASFPPFDQSRWREIERTHHRADEAGGFDYAFVTYQRID